MQNELAIIIPAFKPDYLKETLESILNQTDQRFNLYIIDDASPFQLSQIIENCNLAEDTTYHRFEENLGQHSIVKHWTRCIEQIKHENWIWLFSDDDLMDPHCVSYFYKELDKNPDAVAFRFNTHKIADDGSLIRINQFNDDFNAVTFLNQKLTYSQESYVVETIFSKDGYLAIDGIPDIPLAWTSDDLFTVKLALLGQVRIINGAIVYWRYSNKNISGSKNKRSAILKLESSRLFVNWIYDHREVLSGLKPDNLAIKWYVRQIRSLSDQLKLVDECLAIIRMSTRDLRVWKLYLRMKWDRSKTIAWLKRFLS